ncbi:MAG: sigma-70 family RNA polymerase sigma factor [Verrucomicrobiales bacterium]|nr:sigma-70 family RNA polymerase sigma factor [Verrucomicrobiales bacterium]
MIDSLMTPAFARGDEQLVRASLQGDRDAFATIVARYQTLVSSLAYSATGDLGRSEDLAQETFVAAWNQLDRLREPAHLRAWLCGIARHLIYQSHRSQGRDPSVNAAPLEGTSEAPSPDPLPSERAIRNEEAALLWDALERIPEDYRVPLVLFYREHRSVEAVATALGLSEVVVRQRLSRGRKHLESEVLALVESALTRSTPGPRFTIAVLAALPGAGTSGALSVSSATWATGKGAAATQGTGTVLSLLGYVSLLGAVAFSWGNALAEAPSPAARRRLARAAALQMTGLVVTLLICTQALPRLAGTPTWLGLAMAGLLGLNLLLGVWTTEHLLPSQPDTVSPGVTPGVRSRGRPWRVMLPLVLLFAVGGAGLPWSAHPLRSASVVAGEILVLLWAYRRFQGALGFHPDARSAGVASLRRRWLLLVPAIVLLAAALGAFLPLYLRPEARQGPISPQASETLTALLVGTAVVLVGYGLWVGLHLRKIHCVTRPEALFDDLYAAFFTRTPCTSAERSKLRELVLAQTRSGAEAVVRLMDQHLDDPTRRELNTRAKSDQQRFRDQVHALLGAERYQAFQRHARSVPERTLLARWRAGATGGLPTIGPEEAEAMLAALAEARERFSWTHPLSRRDTEGWDPLALANPEALEVYLVEEARFESEFAPTAQRLVGEARWAEWQSLAQADREAQRRGLLALDSGNVHQNRITRRQL